MDTLLFIYACVVFGGMAAGSENNTNDGLYIVAIEDGCDIANSGLKTDDIITSVEGEPVRSLEELKQLLEGREPGDEVTAHVYRPAITGEGEEFYISFKLMEDNGGLIENPAGKSA